MFAVIETGGKQYKVKKGDIITVEKIEGGEGTKVEFNKVLLLNTGDQLKIGTPLVEGVKVEGEILKQGKGEKLIVFKFKRRKRYRRKKGHRQLYTQVKINEIVFS